MRDRDVESINWCMPVVAIRAIYQSPLSSDPTVPAGRSGTLEDIVDGLLWVDFGSPYGVVACQPAEVRQ